MNTPVLAAGGIADQSAVRASAIMGAEGVWAGTVFVASVESLAHDVYKQRLLEAITDDPKFLTGYSYGWGGGTPHRAMYSHHKFNPLKFVAGGARKKDKPVLAEKITLYAGQDVGKITQILPAEILPGTWPEGFSRNQVKADLTEASIYPVISPFPRLIVSFFLYPLVPDHRGS